MNNAKLALGALMLITQSTAIASDFSSKHAIGISGVSETGKLIKNTDNSISSKKPSAWAFYNYRVMDQVSLELAYDLKNNNYAESVSNTFFTNKVRVRFNQFNVGLNFYKPIASMPELKLLANASLTNRVYRINVDSTNNLTGTTRNQVDARKVFVSPRLGLGLEYNVRPQIFVKGLAYLQYQNPGDNSLYPGYTNQAANKLKNNLGAALSVGYRF